MMLKDEIQSYLYTLNQDAEGILIDCENELLLLWEIQ